MVKGNMAWKSLLKGGAQQPAQHLQEPGSKSQTSGSPWGWYLTVSPQQI